MVVGFPDTGILPHREIDVSIGFCAVNEIVLLIPLLPHDHPYIPVPVLANPLYVLQSFAVKVRYGSKPVLA